MKQIFKLLTIFCLIFFGALDIKAEEPFENAKKLSKVAFADVNVVDVEKEKILPHRTVYIEDGRIKKITETKDAKLEKDVFLIDGREKYLIPGLADMHTHFTGAGAFSSGIEPPLYEEKDLMLFLVNGVTTVRNMAGNEQDAKIKDKLAKEKLLGPHYYSTGRAILTATPETGLGLVIKTQEEAFNTVLDQKKAGNDFIKIYCCFQKKNKEIYDKILETAKANKMRVVGHIQFFLPIEDALKLESIEHFEHIVKYFNEETPDIEKHQSIVQKFLDSKTFICPTLSVFEPSVVEISKTEFLAKEESNYLAKSIYESIKKPDYKGLDEETLEFVKKIYDLEIQYTYFLFRQKIPFILGTDSGGVNHLVIGFSIHRELELLNQAGLSPIEALQTGTINVAKFLGNSDIRGSIVENKESDLVLLDKNPLVDISNTKKISGVMIGKYWIDKASIEKILVTLKKR